MQSSQQQAQEVLDSVLPVLRAQQYTLTYRDGSQTASVNTRKISGSISQLICSFYITQGSSSRSTFSTPWGMLYNSQNILRKEMLWPQEVIP